MKKSNTFYLLIYLFLVLQSSFLFAQQLGTNNVIEKHNLDETGINVLTTIHYYDDLGREFQQVKKGYTARGYDLVTNQWLNASGKLIKEGLPIYVTNSGNLLKEQFVDSLLCLQYNDSAFKVYDYEQSTLERLNETRGPGSAWWIHGGCYYDYFPNFQIDIPEYNASCFIIGKNNILKRLRDYPEGSLNVIDKSGNGDSFIEFHDKTGRIILIRRRGDIPYEYCDNYFVYDNWGQLIYILPPLAVDSLSNDSVWQSSDGVLRKYAYYYEYDGFQRQTLARFPGCEPVYKIYDTNGNLALQQNGNQRSANEWTYQVYDVFGRMVETGICKSTQSLLSLRTVVGAASFRVFPRASESGYNTNSVLPSILTGHKFRKAIYYDNYNFRDSVNFGDNFPAGNNLPKGYVCGQVQQLSDGEHYLKSIYHYDSKGRLIRQISENHIGGLNREETTYTFTGLPLTISYGYSAKNTYPFSEKYSYIYDSMGRLQETLHKFDNSSFVTLSEIDYDELDHINIKKIHNNVYSSEYSYNIRNLSTAITGDKFEQKLYYIEGPGSPRYDGNISSMTWKCGGKDIIRGYCFTYDALCRFKNAIYGEGDEIDKNKDKYNECVIKYDKNGNIQKLKRNGLLGEGSYGTVDNLEYVYLGNQLQNITDSISILSCMNCNFVDKAVQDIKYEYDANGNMIKDVIKGIDNIQYNYLNLPNNIQFEDGSIISYLYDADGVKLQTLHIKGNDTLTIDYCGNAIYENGKLEKLLTEEGYITLTDTIYHYFLQDYQGNNRVVIDQNGNVEEVNHYYPFGGLFTCFSSIQSYKYNGKEFDVFKGLNWLDYGVRQYDAFLCRWYVVDPMSAKYYSMSPYAYCGNNPNNMVDPTGADWYRSNKDGSLMWRRSEDKEYEDEEGNVWANVGAEHLFINGNRALLFQQTKNDKGELILHSSVFGLADVDQYELNLDAAYSQLSTTSSRAAARNWSKEPTLGNWIKFCIIEVAGQYKDPMRVVGGLSAGVAGYLSVGVNKYNSIEDIVQDAGKLSRLKGGVRQGFIRGNANNIFRGLSRQYGVNVQIDPSSGHSYFISGNIRVDLTSSSRGIPTLRIRNGEKLFKIRIQ